MLPVFGVLENLCKALHGRSETVAGMISAVDALHRDDAFDEI